MSFLIVCELNADRWRSEDVGEMRIRVSECWKTFALFMVKSVV